MGTKAKPKGNAKRQRRARGARLNAAQQNLRDTLIVVRVGQDWEWEAIAEEAGISVSQCQRAYKAKRNAMPDLMSMDPLDIVRELVEGFQLSITDFEAMASAYVVDNPPAAVGAKKAANGARADLAALLQATGQLPHELGTLRHVVELRAVVGQIVTVVAGFEAKVKRMKLDPAQKRRVVKAASETRKELESIAGTAREVDQPADSGG